MTWINTELKAPYSPPSLPGYPNIKMPFTLSAQGICISDIKRVAHFDRRTALHHYYRVWLALSHGRDQVVQVLR